MLHPAGFLHPPGAMSLLRHPFPFAIRWSHGEVEGTWVLARSLADAEDRLTQELQARAAAEPDLGRPSIVPDCLLSRAERDHVELDWRRAG